MRALWTVLIGMMVALICVTTDCADDECAPVYRYWSPYGYDVSPTMTTPKGIKVDPSGQNINPARIDRLTDEVEQCLIDTFGNPPKCRPTS